VTVTQLTTFVPF